MATPIIRASQVSTVTNSSAKFTNEMAVGQVYRLAVNTNTWFKVTVTGGSAAADTTDNHFLGSGQAVFLRSPGTGDGFVHVIRDSADGDASLSLCEGIS